MAELLEDRFLRSGSFVMVGDHGYYMHWSHVSPCGRKVTYILRWITGKMFAVEIEGC